MKTATPEELKALVDNGTLHEVNRLVLHPMGLALAVEFDGDGKATGISMIRDDDPEGIVYAPETLLPGLNKEKAEAFRAAFEVRCLRRRSALGFGIQPAGDALTVVPISYFEAP